MLKGANDVPVTGKPFGGTAHQGLHSYYCSPFPIWSVQVSRLTGSSYIYCYYMPAVNLELNHGVYHSIKLQ